MKLCLIYNFAQHYRASIFKLISETFDCDFVFGDSMSDVKKLDYSILQGSVIETHTKRLLGGWYWQPGVVRLLRQPYTHYILLGESRSLSTWLFCILAKAFYRKKKVYFWSHGWYGKESKIESFLKRILFKLPNGGVFLYGNYARNLMIKEGFNSDKLFTIHNSLAYEQQLQIRSMLKVDSVYHDHFQNSFCNLLFVGRLTPVKKLDQILYAMSECGKRGNNYNITFIGGGEKQDELQELAKELNLSNQVWFYGSCYDERLLGQLIFNADLCVAPGNIGLTAMHAMVFGTPCLTHNDFKWQMPEFEAIKEGITGAFFKRDDISSLSKSIDGWFEEHALQREQVRVACMKEIDTQWTPQFQIEVIKKVINQ